MSQSDPCTIGPNLVVRGRLSGEEDVKIEGRVEGQISLNSHLIIETTGSVDAEIEVQMLTVRGVASGTFIGEKTVSLESGAKVTGNIKAPRIIIEDGAIFKGHIDMEVDIPPSLLS